MQACSHLSRHGSKFLKPSARSQKPSSTAYLRAGCPLRPRSLWHGRSRTQIRDASDGEGLGGVGMDGIHWHRYPKRILTVSGEGSRPSRRAKTTAAPRVEVAGGADVALIVDELTLLLDLKTSSGRSRIGSRSRSGAGTPTVAGGSPACL